MICFITSSPTGSLDDSYVIEGLDRNNEFLNHLKQYIQPGCRCLIVAASPDEYIGNVRMGEFFRDVFAEAGIPFSDMEIWDHQTTDFSKEKLLSFDFIIMGGGHVPTQNEFLKEIHLREKLQDFDGVVMGISAGSMNMADIVYSQPELPGEAVNPEYARFMKGLGLTKIQVLPHYQMVKNYILDGMKLYEEITAGDSYGNRFLVLPDGSYVLSVDGVETIWGKAYVMMDGVMNQICENGHSIEWRGER